MTQKDALYLMMMGENIYLTGQAGSGKTYVLNQYIDYLKRHNVPAAVTASTGIAATHINGRTIHSWSGIGIKKELSHQEVKRIIGNEKLRERIRHTKVLIIDEISMLHASRLDMVNKICQLAKQNDRAFGGMQVILCGDFFQLPPIKEGNDQETTFVYTSQSWEELHLVICYLEEQHRQVDDTFLRILQNIRSQEITEYTFETLLGRLNKVVSFSTSPTKLYTHNVDVDRINMQELEKIQKPLHEYVMVTRGKKEIVTALKHGCLAPEILLLKEGALVMFIKNSPSQGYSNGTTGVVKDFTKERYPIVHTTTGQEIIAKPVSWQLEEENVILGEIAQVPLRLAWAITIHKSQGMSLDAAEIDLSKAFVYGMGYVALSRVKSLDGIKLIGINQTALQVDDHVAQFEEELQKKSREAITALFALEEKDIRSKQESYLTSIASARDRETIRKSLREYLNELLH